MDASTSGRNRIWPYWWRFGGLDGIIWAVLFIIGAFVLQGDSPSRTDSIESIRQYWIDDGTRYLVGDFLISVAFMIFFTPYLIALRWFVGRGEGWPPICLGWRSPAE